MKKIYSLSTKSIIKQCHLDLEEHLSVHVVRNVRYLHDKILLNLTNLYQYIAVYMAEQVKSENIDELPFFFFTK